MALNLNTANKSQGLEVIPAGTLVTLAMKLRAGTVGVEGLCKRSSKGASEGVDIEYTVKGGEYDSRKLYAFQILHHGRPRESRRDHARALACDLRGGQCHRSQRRFARGRRPPQRCNACRLQRRDLPRHVGGGGRRPAAGRERSLPRQKRDRQSVACWRQRLSAARSAAADANRALGTAHCTSRQRRCDASYACSSAGSSYPSLLGGLRGEIDGSASTQDRSSDRGGD
jgi:hypothetical protein